MMQIKDNIMASHNSRTTQTGVTLMELLITMVIIGILLATAIPSYTNRIRNANRTEATTTLLALAAAQEKFYLKNSQYTADITALGGNTSIEEMYTLSVAIDVPVVGGFEVKATALSAMQIKDADCREFTVDHTGRRSSVNVVSADTTDICW